MANEVRVLIRADGGPQVSADFKDVGEAADRAGRDVASFGTKLDDTADAGGNAERALQGVSDLTGFLGETVGLNLGPMEEYAGAFANLGGGIEAALQGGPALLAQLKALPASIMPAIAATWAHVTALTAQAVAFIAANAPIIAVIAGIGLLTAGVILLITHWDTIVAAIPGLGTAVETVKGVIETAIGLITGAFQSVLDWVTANWPLIAALLSGPFAPIVLLATDAFGVRSALEGALQAVIDWVTDVWGSISGFVSGPFESIVGAATDAFGVRSAIEGAFTAAKDWIGLKMGEVVAFLVALPGQISAVLEAAGRAALSLADAVVGPIRGILDRVGDIGRAIVEGIWAGIQSLAGWLTSQISGFVGGLVDSALSAVGAGSPAKQWMPLGQFMAQGLAVGFAREVENVTGPGIASAVGAIAQQAAGDIGPMGRQRITYQQAIAIGAQVSHLARGPFPGYAGGPTGPRGGGGMGGVHIYAIDARSFEDWLNRGGGDTIARYFGNRRVFA